MTREGSDTVDVALVRAVHSATPASFTRTDGSRLVGWCPACQQPAPCTTLRLLDAYEAMERRAVAAEADWQSSEAARQEAEAALWKFGAHQISWCVDGCRCGLNDALVNTGRTEWVCPACRIERADMEGGVGEHLPTCPNCSTQRPPALARLAQEGGT